MFEKLFGGIVSMLAGDLTAEQRKFLSDFVWRCLVTFQIAAAWGMLGFLGISGFTKAQETAALRQEIHEQKQASVLQARLGIVREIRAQRDTMCSTSDQVIRNTIMNTIDRLREDYRAVTGESFAEVRCP